MRPGLTTISISEGHKERMEFGGLGKHLRLKILMDFGIQEREVVD